MPKCTDRDLYLLMAAAINVQHEKTFGINALERVPKFTDRDLYLLMAEAIDVQHEKTFEINAFEKQSEKEPDQM